MKKFFLLGCLLLVTACASPLGGQSSTATPVAPLFPTETASPTPVPVTETPAPTASRTSEPTPTPFPRYFTIEFDSSLAGWAILQAGNEAVPNITLENSRLLVQMDAAYTWVYSLYGPEDYDNVRVDTRFINNAMSPASAGVVCRYSETDGWFEYNVSTDGTYSVLYGKWLASGIAAYMPIADGSSNAIQQSGTEQQIGLICTGTTLTLLIGETIIRNVDVSRFKLVEGKVGVTAASYENVPVIVSFDSVTVSEP
ncbi:MAG TPA: hypothetical protein VJ785_18560 [Anaerolineales bacterium]|nr:hypothetical protein [Anaerolineales bacterium]